MKTFFYAKTLLALAVAVATATSAVSQAQDQPTPPTTATTAPAATTDAGVPAGIVAGSPLSDVIKMLQAGVDAATIQSYIANSQNPFNLDADKIVYLRDLGASTEVINATMERDKALATAAAPPTPAPPAAPVPDAAPAAPPVEDTPPAPAPDFTQEPAPDAADTSMAPPAADLTVDYFNSNLAPYGSWVNLDGYGRCWRPTVVIYNSGWSPYCDKAGHWVYTDYGWYWNSDYAWGSTFHYGRWFRDARYGWCWYPATVWAPSWVVWRSSDEYCGWAPLPPWTEFQPGIGFFFRGVTVGADFDFDLPADAFVFVGAGHFCDLRPRSFCVPQAQVATVFRQTTVINHYDVHGKTVVNRGFDPGRIAAATHRPIEPVRVSTLGNAGRQGWRGEGYRQTLRPETPYREVRATDNAGRNGPAGYNNNGAGREWNGNGYNPDRGNVTGNPRTGAETSANRGPARPNGQGAQPIDGERSHEYNGASERGLSEPHNNGESEPHNDHGEAAAHNANGGSAPGSSPAPAPAQSQAHGSGNSPGSNNKNNQNK